MYICIHTYIMCIYTYIHMYIYIYIYREREMLHIYIYIHSYLATGAAERPVPAEAPGRRSAPRWR